MREAFRSGRKGGPVTGVPGTVTGVPGAVREEETP
jgi:hypothetical protein